jgi:dTDP-4-dehydrorhamnose reductase
MIKIALFGATGQVGRETILAAAASNDVDVVALSRAEADLSAAGAAASAIRRLAPDVVLNAAAWTAVDKAEAERSAAERLNAAAPGEMAAAAYEIGARLIHLSTDYVFPGDGASPLDETAPVRPLNVYGATKLQGEREVMAKHPAAIVIRTSWVFSAHGGNFVKTMLRLATQMPEVSVVADQRGGPTSASAIAAACLAVARKKDGPAGLYHFQGAPDASWADFAEAIFRAAGTGTKVKRTPSRDYKTPAARPLFTVLNCSKIKRDYGINQPDWRRDVEAAVADLTHQGNA